MCASRMENNSGWVYVLSSCVDHFAYYQILFFISVNMTCVDKMILALVILQVALVLAKPYERDYDEGLYLSNYNKRASKRQL